MDVCKCIEHLRHGSTLNCCQAASPLVRLVKGVDRWEAPDHPQVSSVKIGVKTSQIVLSPVWCSKLRLTTGVTYPFAMMKFVGLDLALTDQVVMMSDCEMNLTPALSYTSRSNNSSRSATPKSTEPPTACERRRLAMAREKTHENNRWISEISDTYEERKR
ncbi:uncharacterized protein TNCV_646321 [Trichonephila clavipes]|nr:uncharacterized protein TNCV_646321 [Trichonephila clavipes]